MAATLPGRKRSFARTLRCFLLVYLAAYAQAACAQSTNPYLARIAHGQPETFSCVLVDAKVVFHYENDDGASTRVYEGNLTVLQLQGIENNLNAISALAQRQIEEPLIHGPRD